MKDYCMYTENECQMYFKNITKKHGVIEIVFKNKEYKIVLKKQHHNKNVNRKYVHYINSKNIPPIKNIS